MAARAPPRPRAAAAAAAGTSDVKLLPAATMAATAAVRKAVQQRAARVRRKTKAEELKQREDAGEPVLKRVGGRWCFHVRGEKKSGVESFLRRRVLAPLDNTCRTLEPLCPRELPVAAREEAIEEDTEGASRYHKSMRGTKRGTFIHKQAGRLIRAAAAEAQCEHAEGAKHKGQRGRLSGSGRRMRDSSIHPHLRSAFRLLNRLGFVPLDTDFGVTIGDWATELDLVCYRIGKPMTDVYIFELKTGYNDVLAYHAPSYRVRWPTTTRGVTVTASERDKHLLQLTASVLQAAETYRGRWRIRDAFLLGIHATHSDLIRLPIEFLRLRSQLLAQLSSSRSSR